MPAKKVDNDKITLKIHNPFESMKESDVMKQLSKKKPANPSKLLPIFGKEKNDGKDEDNISPLIKRMMVKKKYEYENQLRESKEKAQKKKKEAPKKRLPDVHVNFEDPDLLDITKVDTKKNNIPQRHLMKECFIPRFPRITIIAGPVKSGKTTFFHNLLKKPQFYGTSNEGLQPGENPRPYFDYVFLFTGSDDDMYNDLIADGLIQEQHIKFSPTPADIGAVMEAQRQMIEEKGLENAPRVMVVLEDLADDQQLIKSREFKALFTKPRQHNISTFMMTQYLRFAPPYCRRNATNLFIFGSDRASLEIIGEEFCPSKMTKKNFMDLVEYAQTPNEKCQFPFFNINKEAENKDEKFRQNLNIALVPKALE